MGKEKPENYVVSKADWGDIFIQSFGEDLAIALCWAESDPWQVRFLYDLVGGKYRIRTKVLEVLFCPRNKHWQHTKSKTSVGQVSLDVSRIKFCPNQSVLDSVNRTELQVQTPRRYQINAKLQGLVLS